MTENPQTENLKALFSKGSKFFINCNAASVGE